MDHVTGEPDYIPCTDSVDEEHILVHVDATWTYLRIAEALERIAKILERWEVREYHAVG